MAAKRETETALLRRVVHLRDKVDRLKAKLAEEQDRHMRSACKAYDVEQDLRRQVDHYRWQSLRRLEGVQIQAASGTPVAWQN